MIGPAFAVPSIGTTPALSLASNTCQLAPPELCHQLAQVMRFPRPAIPGHWPPLCCAINWRKSCALPGQQYLLIGPPLCCAINWRKSCAFPSQQYLVTGPAAHALFIGARQALDHTSSTWSLWAACAAPRPLQYDPYYPH